MYEGASRRWDRRHEMVLHAVLLSANGATWTMIGSLLKGIF